MPVSLAAVLTATRSIELREVARPGAVGDGGWLDVEACGMCGTDWHWYAERELPGPMVLGHEIVARVSDLWGELAASSLYSVGDRVVLEEAIPCLACPLCRSGRHRMCRASSRYGAIPLARDPGLWGGFAERVFLHPRAGVHRVPEGLDPVLASLYVPVSNGLSWVRSAAELRPGETIVVVGPGQHGLACIAAARRLGAGFVIAVGREGDEDRLETARALGADVAIADSGGIWLERVRDLAPLGVDVLIDTTPDSESVLASAVRAAAVSGRIIVVGNKHGRASSFATDDVFRKELTVRGVAARESWAIPAALDWLNRDSNYFRAFRLDVVGLPDVEEGILQLGGSGGVGRSNHTVVVP